jgi:hypothetical protein
MLASMTERPSQVQGTGGHKKIVVGPWKWALEGAPRLARGPCGEVSLPRGVHVLIFRGNGYFLIAHGAACDSVRVISRGDPSRAADVRGRGEIMPCHKAIPWSSVLARRRQS